MPSNLIFVAVYFVLSKCRFSLCIIDIPHLTCQILQSTQCPSWRRMSFEFFTVISTSFTYPYRLNTRRTVRGRGTDRQNFSTEPGGFTIPLSLRGGEPRSPRRQSYFGQTSAGVWVTVSLSFWNGRWTITQYLSDITLVSYHSKIRKTNPASSSLPKITINNYLRNYRSRM